MPKRAKPRWGEHGVSEVPDFSLNAQEAHEAAAILGITRQADIDRLAAELSEIGRQYLRWTAQDEQGPGRAERNAALTEVIDTSRRLEFLLKALDHASEADLIDALPPYRSTNLEYDEDGTVTIEREWQELGFRQIQALRDRLTHFNMVAYAFVRRQMRRRGPDRKKTPLAVIGMLAEIFERETGKPPTHTPFKGTEYKSAPQSQAGRFIVDFLKIVDPQLPPSKISSTLAEILKKRRSKSKKKN